jgi:hypothetical protein
MHSEPDAFGAQGEVVMVRIGINGAVDKAIFERVDVETFFEFAE